MARVRISRHDLLKTFQTNYNLQEKPLDETPDLMVSEMKDKQPYCHLFSKYVIRPNHFDRDPFTLPKNAVQHRGFFPARGRGSSHQQHLPQFNPSAQEDDFQTVEAPQKKRIEPAQVVPADKPIPVVHPTQEVVIPAKIAAEVVPEVTESKPEPKAASPVKQEDKFAGLSAEEIAMQIEGSSKKDKKKKN